MARIKDLQGFDLLDSRGNPTVGSGDAAVNSASRTPGRP